MSSKSVIEVGPPTKRKKSSATNVSTICLLCKEICSEQHIYTQKQWDALKLRAKEWSGLDKYGFVCSKVDWEKDTRDDQFFTGNVRKICKLKVSFYRLKVGIKEIWHQLHRIVYYHHQIQVLTNNHLLCQYRHLL